jgi:hypothetical protein
MRDGMKFARRGFFGHFQFPGRIGYKFGWSHKIRHRQIQECQIQHRQETTISPQE